MRVDLKGIHSAHAILADGTRITYWYAWRGGPRLSGKPGTPDFIASYNEAMAQRSPTPQGRLQILIDGYQQSGEFRTLRERTRVGLHQTNKDHRTGIRRLPDQGAGRARDARRVHGLARQAGDQIARGRPTMRGRVLARILSWAKNRGKITVNPCERGGRLYDGTRVDFVWTLDDEAAFLERAGAPALAAIARACGPASGRAICCD